MLDFLGVIEKATTSVLTFTPPYMRFCISPNSVFVLLGCLLLR